MMVITESIEMELFSSEESCVGIQTVGEEEQIEKDTSNQVSESEEKWPHLRSSQTPQMYPSVLMSSCDPVICGQVLLNCH